MQLDTLDALTDVTSVVFEATKQLTGTLIFPLICGIGRRGSIPRVYFDGSFAFPFAIDPFPSVRSRSLRANGEAARVIEVSLPQASEGEAKLLTP